MTARQIPIPADLQMGSETAAWVLDQITTFPETHDQSLWFSVDDTEACGTVGCVAGWAAQPHLSQLQAESELNEDFYFDWEAWGKQALGLDWEQATYLFAGIRSRDEVLLALKELANGDPMTIPEQLVLSPEARELLSLFVNRLES